MADIFVSYAAEDRGFAQRLAAALRQAGWSVWWDQKIPPGLTYAEVIEHELNESRCAIVVWSAHSVGSQWVRNEAREALDRRILVPIRIDGSKLPFEFRHVQVADLTEWTGNAEQPELTPVIARIRELTGIAGEMGRPSTGLMQHESDGGEVSDRRSRRVIRQALGATAVLLLLGVSYIGYHTLRSKPQEATSSRPVTSSTPPAPHSPEAVTGSAPAPVTETRAVTSTIPADTSGRAAAAAPTVQPRPGVRRSPSTSPPSNMNSPLQPVFFERGRTSLSPDARRPLNANVATLKQYATWAITLEGHADEAGTAEENLALGERRALAVRTYLVSAGISSERLRTVSYGMEFPFDPSNTEAARARNRRVHFVITAK